MATRSCQALAQGPERSATCRTTWKVRLTNSPMLSRRRGIPQNISPSSDSRKRFSKTCSSFSTVSRRSSSSPSRRPWKKSRCTSVVFLFLSSEAPSARTPTRPRARCSRVSSALISRIRVSCFRAWHQTPRLLLMSLSATESSWTSWGAPPRSSRSVVCSVASSSLFVEITPTSYEGRASPTSSYSQGMTSRWPKICRTSSWLAWTSTTTGGSTPTCFVFRSTSFGAATTGFGSSIRNSNFVFSSFFCRSPPWERHFFCHFETFFL